ncbi:MAG: hypothetical protein ACE5KH_01130 [Candidatus Geothermarchaeales archaeon]
MGFFKRLFGSEPKPEVREIRPAELDDSLRRKRDETNRSAVEACQGVHDALLDARSRLLEAVEELSDEEAPSTFPSAMRRRIESARNGFVKGVVAALEAVETWEPGGLSDLEESYSSFLHLLERMRGLTGIHGRYLSTYAKIHRSLLIQLKRLASSVKELDDSLTPWKENLELLEGAESSARRLKAKLDELKDLQRRIQDSEEAIEVAATRFEDLEKRIADLKASPEYEDLLEAQTRSKLSEAQVEERKAKIRHRFSPLRRVLKKFSKKVGDGKFTLSRQASKRLEGYINAPLDTVLEESPDHPALREMLVGAGRMLDSGEIGLKEASRKKASHQIDEILGGDLRRQLSEYRESVEFLEDARRGVASHSFLSEFSEAKELLEKHQARIQALTTRMKESERKISSVEVEIRETRGQLEEQMGELYGVHIKVLELPESLSHEKDNRRKG